MDVLNDDVVKYERPAARASVDGLERPRVAIYLDMRSNIAAAAAAAAAVRAAQCIRLELLRHLRRLAAAH